MSGYLSRRVAKLEDRRRKRVRVPHIAEQRQGESPDQAIARFRERYGDAIPARHSVLIVPAYADMHEFAAALKAQQTALFDWVKARHPKETAQC